MSNMGRMEARWADPEIRHFSDYSDSGIKRAPRVRTGAPKMDVKTEIFLRKLFDTPSIDEKGGEVK